MVRRRGNIPKTNKSNHDIMANGLPTIQTSNSSFKDKQPTFRASFWRKKHRGKMLLVSAGILICLRVLQTVFVVLVSSWGTKRGDAQYALPVLLHGCHGDPISIPPQPLLSSNSIPLVEDAEEDRLDLAGMSKIGNNKNNKKKSPPWYQVHPKFATDDDAVIRTQAGYDDENVHNCRHVAEHRLMFPTCNLMHEQDRVHQPTQLLGSGSYRQVFGMSNPGYVSTTTTTTTALSSDVVSEAEYFALKQLLYSMNPSLVKYRESIRMDALVAERLTQNPYIVNIYGYCGVSVVNELFVHGDLERTAVVRAGRRRMGYSNLGYEQNQTTVASYNGWSWKDRLRLALDMARGLAGLHGYPRGVLVHNDVQMSQFLTNADQSLVKLNDFNRAEWMLWDDTRQEYCRYKNGIGPGSHRSPEEYWNHPLNEKIDVYSLGNNLYMLITGLYPFFQVSSAREATVQGLVKQGVRPFLHYDWKNHGPAARLLVEVVEQCWIEDPDERPSIFKVVEMLQTAWDGMTGDEQKPNV